MDRFRYLVVEGPIGAGKTSLARRLASRFTADLLLELPEENPFLSRFYQDMARFALPTQLFFLFQRARLLEPLAQPDMFGRPVVGDFLLDKDPLFARITLSADEMALYQKIYEALRPRSPSPDLVVYLQAQPATLIERVRRRAKGYEKPVSEEYLALLAESYARFFYHYNAANYEGGPIQEAVRRIGRKLGETILLGTSTDIYVEIVDILRARQPLQYYTHVGSRVLLVHSGLGWPLLSELADDEVARIYRRTVRQNKIERGVSSLNRLRGGIAQVRDKGYCLSRGMVTRGVGVVGLMVPTPPGHRKLAIGVAGPQERIEKNLMKILAAIRAENVRLLQFASADG